MFDLVLAGYSSGVSVPLRGKGRDQRILPLRMWGSRVYVVSVPLRGKGRDQLPVVNSDTFIESHPFPSPCGEKVGINVIREKMPGSYWTRFPSPCGEKVGINTLCTLQCMAPGLSVSVPLRGKGRDQLVSNLSIQTCNSSFRPLAGKR